MGEKYNFTIEWAKKFKSNPKKYRPILNGLLNAQLMLAQKRLEKLHPKELIKRFDIKNIELIRKLYERYWQQKNLINQI